MGNILQNSLDVTYEDFLTLIPRKSGLGCVSGALDIPT